MEFPPALVLNGQHLFVLVNNPPAPGDFTTEQVEDWINFVVRGQSLDITAEFTLVVHSDAPRLTWSQHWTEEETWHYLKRHYGAGVPFVVAHYRKVM